MSLFSQHITPTKYSKSYASEANAIKAVTVLIDAMQEDAPKFHNPRRAQFVITKNEEGRFAPVIIADISETVFYAQRSFAVIGV
tara:strand:- start:659 stop:910 length:252 start_codon:yes stop_codon:yes gene_type:complete